VRLMKEREAALARVYAAIDAGLADVKAGRTKPLQEVAARLISKYRGDGRKTKVMRNA